MRTRSAIDSPSTDGIATSNSCALVFISMFSIGIHSHRSLGPVGGWAE
jgi:hypothetical protein